MFKRSAKIKQQDWSDCGIACLLSVAAHYGIVLSREKLKQLAGTDISGTTLAGLMEAAEKSGFVARGARGTIASLSEISLPAIAHVILDSGLHHYVVILKHKRGYLKIMDPADAKIQKTRVEAFAGIWTGILLLLVPCGPFPQDQDYGTTTFFKNILKTQRGLYIRMMVGAVLFMLLGLSSSFYLRNITDTVWLDGNVNLLHLLSISMIALLSAQLVIGIFRNLISLYIANHTDKRLIIGYLRRLIDLPNRFFDTVQTGDIISRINDAVKIRIFLNETIVGLAVNILLILSTAAIMFLTNWKLALMAMSVIPVYGIFFLISLRAHGVWSRRAMEQGAAVEAGMVERIAAIRLIKRFDLGSSFIGYISDLLNPLLRTNFVAGRFSTWHNALIDFFTRLLTVILLWKGSAFVLSGTLSPGELLSFYTLIGVFTESAAVLATAPKSLEDARNAARRLIGVFNVETEETDSALSTSSPESGSLTLQNLSFSFPGRGTVLKNINMYIPASSLTAIVGESGCGKSTLLALLQRVYEPSAGRILCGQTDLRLISLRSLRQHIGVVPQHTELFSETVIENIAPGAARPRVPLITELCRLLEMEEFIHALPAGYLTKLANAGSALSGGQKQRIAIARALYRDPAILLLDEPTASLDPKSTRAIVNTLNHYRSKGTTLIIVTHSREMLQLCDKVFFLEDGTLAAEGSHSELLESNAAYRALWTP